MNKMTEPGTHPHHDMNESIESGTLSRYDMSYNTFRQLQRDHIRFEEKYTRKFSNNFICRILINYMEYAQKYFIEKFEEDIANLLENKQYSEYVKNDRISFTKVLTKKIKEFDFTHHNNFRKRTVVTYILERFTALQLSEREKIYFYKQYSTIADAIDKKEILIIRNSSGKEYEVRGYGIEVDDNSLSYYLMGYSREKWSDDEYKLYSLKLSRIKECSSKHREFTFSAKETRTAKEISEKFGCAYMAKDLMKKDMKKTIVRLTEHGYKTLFLKVIAHQRPIPVLEPKSIKLNGIQFFELEFDCSYEQIRNYFFSFGTDAEIISPLLLRQRFVNDYQKALDQYLTKKD